MPPTLTSGEGVEGWKLSLLPVANDLINHVYGNEDPMKISGVGVSESFGVGNHVEVLGSGTQSPH